MARSRGRILVIIERVSDFEALVPIFASQGYEAVWAATGNDGIRLAESNEPDVILLDLTLPDIPGLDVCRNLRLRNSTWSIPIILVLEDATDETALVRGMELGANDCIARPFKKFELLARIGVLLRIKRVEDKLRRLYVERTRELEWSNMELQKIRTQLILKNQMSTLGMMVAVAAHEIRSPATSISGNIDLVGDLQQEFVEQLPELFERLSEWPEEHRQLFSALMLDVARRTAQEAPLDMLSRRREVRRLADLLLDRWSGPPAPEPTVQQLAKLRLTDHLDRLLPLVADHGWSVLDPLLAVGELQIKLHNMRLSIQRINSIVRSMKAYSHIDRSDWQEVDIQEGLEDTLTIMNYIFRGTVELHRSFAPNLPRIRGYPGELNQVWTNLLQNAYDALEANRGRVAVETRPGQLEGMDAVVVAISDNGKGIPKEILPHIFDSFFTTKEKGKGSGLGLDICKRIVEKHRGTIEVSSVPGNTTFTVLLPLHGGEQGAQDAADALGSRFEGDPLPTANRKDQA